MSTLLAAVDEGSLSAASRALGVPLSTVSRRVADLEAHLGTGLINRTSRRVELTEAGRNYVVACRRILADIEETELTAAGEYKVPRGELTITAPIVFGRLHLLPVVTAFLGAYPDIDVRLTLADRVFDLVDEHVDVALRIGDLPDSSLHAVRVGDVRMNMPHRLVPMQVAVLTDWQRVVGMGVVPVVMAVGMFMLRFVVLMFMPVTFRQMKHDARGHQHRTDQHPGTAAAFAQQEREQGADEGCEREHRPGARGTERTLGQQVEAKAQSVAGRAHREQGQRGQKDRHGFPKDNGHQGRGDRDHRGNDGRRIVVCGHVHHQGSIEL